MRPVICKQSKWVILSVVSVEVNWCEHILYIVSCVTERCINNILFRHTLVYTYVFYNICKIEYVCSSNSYISLGGKLI